MKNQNQGDRAPRAFEQMGQEQLAIYARELRQHFLEEQRLRVRLQEQYRNLQQRMREIEGLNRLFQEHLANYFQVASKLEQIGEEVQALNRLTKQMAPA